MGISTEPDQFINSPAQLTTDAFLTNELSEGQFYSRSRASASILNLFREELGLDISELDCGRVLTLGDYFTYCQSASDLPSEELAHKLQRVRELYFESKYINYNYEDDLRGVVHGWAEEIRQILSDQAIDLTNSNVLDIGCGNGLELTELFHDARRVIGVDLSQRMLDSAAKRFGSDTFYRASAEDLAPIENASVDVYISVRTYASRFFDQRAALREAHRVLRPGGLILLSIPNGYSELSDGTRKIIKGMLSQGSDRLVDQLLPYKYRDTIRSLMADCGWDAISGQDKMTDVFVWARRAMQ
jgi:ubiquinone/menaquinone biosynthesis C-methylase UbiE